MNLGKKTIQTLAAHLFVFAQGILITPIVIKVSGPEVYGAYILLLSFMSILFGVSSLGVGIDAKRWLPSAQNSIERARLFYPQFWFQLSSVIILGGISAFIAFNFKISLNFKISIASACLIPIYLLTYSLLSQGIDYFRSTHRIGIFNFFNVIHSYFYICIALSIYWKANVLNTETLIVSLSLSNLVIGGYVFYRVYSEIGFEFQKYKTKDLIREIKIGYPLILAFVVDVVLAGGDRYIIAALLSVREVGFYSPAYVIGSLIVVLPKVFGVVIRPVISKYIDEGKELEAKEICNNAARIFLFVSIPYAFGASAIGKDILSLYADREISEAAWIVIPIVAIASIYYGLTVIKSNILFVRLKIKLVFQINLICAFINIALNIILIHIFQNIVSAAIATLISYFLGYLLFRMAMKKEKMKLTFENLEVIYIIVCSAVMYCVLNFIADILDPQETVTVAFKLVVGIATYLTLICFLPSSRKYIQQLVNTIRLR